MCCEESSGSWSAPKHVAVISFAVMKLNIEMNFVNYAHVYLRRLVVVRWFGRSSQPVLWMSTTSAPMSVYAANGANCLQQCAHAKATRQKQDSHNWLKRCLMKSKIRLFWLAMHSCGKLCWIVLASPHSITMHNANANRSNKLWSFLKTSYKR